MKPHLRPRDIGWIEVIAGCMFSGKTEELIRRMRRAQYAKQSIVVFKPRIDDRYSEDEVGSHGGHLLPSVQINRAEEIPALVRDALVVGIDEAQFIEGDLVRVAEDLANSGRRVIIAGLDLDYRGIPFDPMPHLMAVAEYVEKVLAICVICGNPADRSQRIVESSSRVLVGETDAYEPRCRGCWDPNDPSPRQERLPFGKNLAEQRR